MHIKRNGLKDVSVINLSNRIQNNFLTSTLYNKAKIIALYNSIFNEVHLDLIFIQAKKDNKCIVFPKIIADKLSFYKITKLNDLVLGKFNIKEPNKNSKMIPINKIDLFLLPGLSFDPLGGRIGYGKGYYDRSLQKRNKNAILVGVCYKFQLIDRLLATNGDIRMDKIITEDGIINCKGVAYV